MLVAATHILLAESDTDLPLDLPTWLRCWAIMFTGVEFILLQLFVVGLARKLLR